MNDHLYRARSAEPGATLVERVRPAHTHWTRLRGLLGTRSLPADEGLWLRPCQQVHMFGMRYPVDAVFLDADHRVIRVAEHLQPQTVSPKVQEATSVLEIAAGAWGRSGLHTGAQLIFEATTPDALRAEANAGRVGAVLCNLALAALYVLFAAGHIAHGLKTGEWATIAPIVAQETMLVVLFLTRRRSVATSTRPFDWIVGIIGVFLPLLFRPLSTGGLWIGLPLQACGLVLAVLALGFLGRSVGIVAANRGIQTAGLYRYVRHPIYSAYLLSYAGYVLTHPDMRNALIAVGTLLALHTRALVEERFLAQDPDYRQYLGQNPWRFVPYVY